MTRRKRPTMWDRRTLCLYWVVTIFVSALISWSYWLLLAAAGGAR